MRKPNRLINERSPYLLQHAYNPVDWYPWGEEAINKAKAENKPIFLSIGYSSCHWCHVMERESFEDEKIAELLNTYYVPVKVDREERPDIDELYMKSVLMITGHGGWPLTVFLTPDLKPFFGGTYFPPRRRGGLRGLDEILRDIAELWRKNPEELRKAAEQNVDMLRAIYTTETSPQIPSHNLVTQTFDVLASSFDGLYGGFGLAPKFPMPVYIEFLQTYAVIDKNTAALKMASATLENMARGGIFDQLAGGFFRYSTDRIWLIPHFEKMLYDNALLAKVLLQNYQLTGSNFLRGVAVETLNWMLSELAARDGGFYSAVDADSPEGEGAFYVWRLRDVYDVLDEELAGVACKVFGVTDAGNFEHGKNVLTFKRDIESLAEEMGVDASTVLMKIREIKSRMLEARYKRPRPAVDDKIIASWNGLALSAFCLGYQITGENRYLDAAVKTADFILSNMWTGSRLYRIYKNGVGVEGFLDDYAFFSNGLLDLFQTNFDPKYLRAAVEIAHKMLELFWDGEHGGFFYSTESTAGLSRIKEAYDGVIPSGNSLAALTFLKLSDITGKTEYLEIVEKVLKCFASRMESLPSEHATMVTALAGYYGTRTQVVISCNKMTDARDFLSLLWKSYAPFRTVVVVDDQNRNQLEDLSPLVRDKPVRDNRPTAYVCHNFTCKMPVSTVDEFAKMLR
ncbi:MAG: thioredoxin domain-containing protein [Candidatus Caldarchaeum sp.]|nr:thioredoxin domain-containing protein [Candidatus Caldarchaeum sp.]